MYDTPPGCVCYNALYRYIEIVRSVTMNQRNMRYSFVTVSHEYWLPLKSISPLIPISPALNTCFCSSYIYLFIESKTKNSLN